MWLRDAGRPRAGGRAAGTRRLRGAPSPLVVMAGDDRQLAARARTGGAAPVAGVPARQAGARLRTVPARLRGTRRGAAPVRLPLMARAGIPRRTSAAVVRRRARLTGPAGPRPAAGDGPRGTAGLRGQRASQHPGLGTAGLPRAGQRGSRAPRAAVAEQPGSASGGYRGRSRTSDDGGFVLRPRGASGEGSRGRTSPGGRPGRHGRGRGFRRNTEAGSDFRAARRPADAGSRRTAPGDARRSPRPAGGSEGSRGDSSRAPAAPGKGRPLVMAAVTGHRGQPGSWARDAGQATAGPDARDQARSGGRRPDEAPARGHGTAYEAGPQVPDSISAQQLDPKRGLS